MNVSFFTRRRSRQGSLKDINLEAIVNEFHFPDDDTKQQQQRAETGNNETGCKKEVENPIAHESCEGIVVLESDLLQPRGMGALESFVELIQKHVVGSEGNSSNNHQRCSSDDDDDNNEDDIKDHNLMPTSKRNSSISSNNGIKSRQHLRSDDTLAGPHRSCVVAASPLKSLKKILYWDQGSDDSRISNQKQDEYEEQSHELSRLLQSRRIIEKLLDPSVLLDFSACKDLGLVVSTIIHRNLGEIVSYIRSNPLIMSLCAAGYFRGAEMANVCGLILHECLRYESLAKIFIYNSSDFESLFNVCVSESHFDVAADAFCNLTLLLTAHQQVVSTYLRCCDSSTFFRQFNRLIQSDNFAIKREALQLLSNLLLEPKNFNLMLQYVSSKQHLKMIMMLLREKSRSLRREAFHVFKIFVANPNKTAAVNSVLVRNHKKLIEFLECFDANDDKVGVPTFEEERELLIYTLSRMSKPVGTVKKEENDKTKKYKVLSPVTELSM